MVGCNTIVRHYCKCFLRLRCKKSAADRCKPAIKYQFSSKRRNRWNCWNSRKDRKACKSGDKKESSSKMTDISSRNSDSDIHTDSENNHTERPSVWTDRETDSVKRDVIAGIRSFTTELFKKQYEMNEDKNQNVFMSAFSVYSALIPAA